MEKEWCTFAEIRKEKRLVWLFHFRLKNNLFTCIRDEFTFLAIYKIKITKCSSSDDWKIILLRIVYYHSQFNGN